MNPLASSILNLLTDILLEVRELADEDNDPLRSHLRRRTEAWKRQLDGLVAEDGAGNPQTKRSTQ